MSSHFTEAQIRMLICRAERQLEEIVAGCLAQKPPARHISKRSHPVAHETIVSVVTLFRDHVAGAAGVATLIAREYAKGVDSTAGVPTLASIERILGFVREANCRFSQDT
jgi:hypothetical protein